MISFLYGNMLLTSSRIKLKIIGMDCASCAKIAEKVLEGREGIESVGVNFLMNAAYVDFDSAKISETAIKDVIKKAGVRIFYRVLRREPKVFLYGRQNYMCIRPLHKGH